jgi:GNAT superfamily N-acetyltransferase
MTGPAAALVLAREEAVDDEAMKIVADGLSAHSASLGLPADWTPRWILGRDAEGAIQAGLRYLTAFEWLFVHLLWVAEPYRKRGEGSRLLAEAEAAAQEAGCVGAYLDTFSFQAPDFYRRHGYREFGRLDDFPRGRARLWFAKRFEPAPGAPS